MHEFNMKAAEAKFNHSFEKAWDDTISKYDINQAQLAEGSHLRPLMVFWGYMAAVSAPHTSSQIMKIDYIADVAVSIELIHKATILIDDWIDEDRARHGKNAFHVEYGPYYTVILALHMISDSIIKLKAFLPLDIKAHNNYYICSDILANTIYSMSKGALEELKLESNRFNLEHIKEIAKLETAEIIGNALQLGYFAGLGDNINDSNLLKYTGIRFGYLFQVMNDMEAFADQDSLITHKGNLNDDVNISRKNVAVALLYNIASKHDKTIVANGSYSDIVKLMKKYKVLDFIVSETELFYSKIIEDFQKSTFEKTWISNFIIFMQEAKTKAYQKLGLT